MKKKLVSLAVLYMLAAAMVPVVGLSGDAGDSTLAAPVEMLIWEGYAKGHVTITQLADASFRVINTADVDVEIDEEVQMLSPSPLDLSPQTTTQDGTLTEFTIPAQSSQIFTYGDPGAQGLPPHWWCTEDTQQTQGGVSIMLGGEVLPYAIRDDILTLPRSGRQDALWAHQRANPVVVVGKTPLWTEIPDNQQNEISIQIAVTNTGFVGASSVLVTDTVPKDFSWDPGSLSPQPDVVMVDVITGITTFLWSISLDAAMGDGGWADPAIYDTELITYKMKTPILSEGRYYLPRAYVDHDSDSSIDAHSAKPLLEVYHINEAPIPDAGGFYYVKEGDTLTFDASGSTDPEGDPIQFRWDLDVDGVWDTSWLTSPTIDLTKGDDVTGMVKLEVTDGEDSAVDFAYYLFENVAPSLNALDYVVTGTQPRTIGYWGRQCWDWLPPSPDHLGILPGYVQFISSSSQVFSSVQSKEDVCFYLEEVVHSITLEKAKQQLIANWLNVASGNLSLETQIDLPDQNYTGTVGEFLNWAESVILNNDEDEFERVKTIADFINNGVGVEIATVIFTASATDQGSDDISFAWDFGDGNTQGPDWVYNDGVGPDPKPSPEGTYPFTAGTTVTASYMGLGTYTVQLTLGDDDFGEITHVVDILVA